MQHMKYYARSYMYDVTETYFNISFAISFQDIDECTNSSYHYDNGNCSNTIGSWDVACNIGFTRSKDQDNFNKSCVGKLKSKQNTWSYQLFIELYNFFENLRCKFRQLFRDTFRPWFL